MDIIKGFMDVEIKPGQIWIDGSNAKYGDIARFCVTQCGVTKRGGVPWVELTNCAHMRKVFANGQDQINSFTLDLELTDEKPAPELFGGYAI